METDAGVFAADAFGGKCATNNHAGNVAALALEVLLQ